MFEDQLEAERARDQGTTTTKGGTNTKGRTVPMTEYDPTGYTDTRRKQVLDVMPEVGAGSPDQGPAVMGSKVKVKSSETYRVRKGIHSVPVHQETVPGYGRYKHLMKSLGEKTE